MAQGFVYHTISATRGRKPFLADAENATLVLEAINFVRREGSAYLLAYAILPDHVHLLIAPRKDVSLPEVMKAIKSFSAREINRRVGRKGAVWQQSYYDRVIRDESQLDSVIEYMHRNPVEAGLSQTPQEYAFCSAYSEAIVDLEAFFTHASS
jgi:putative DNA methylase